MIKKIMGLVAAPLTPTKKDGSINLDIIEEYVSFLAKNGVVGAFVSGTTGEAFSFNVKEKLALMEKWVEFAPKDFKVMIHIGATSIEDTKILGNHAQDIGAYAIGSMGPIFFKPKTVEDLVDHVAIEAASAPNLPYYYYHIPGMSGVSLPMPPFLKLSGEKIPNLVGIKYSFVSNYVDLKHCMEFDDQKFDILYGQDETLLSSLAYGAKGAVGSTYNIAAPLYNELMDEFSKKNVEKARQLQWKSVQMVKVLLDTGNLFSALKNVMNKIGLDMGSVRTPLKDISKEKIETMFNSLDNIGFSEFCSKK